MTTRRFDFLNLGAVVQSTRLALEMNQADYPVALTAAYFADTQDEPVAVYDHLQWIRKTVTRYPINIVTKGRLSDHLRIGQNSTGHRFASIPAFTLRPDNTEGKVRRQCSSEYKIEPITKAIREHIGAIPRRRIPKDAEVVQYLGISADEAGRAVRVMRNELPEKVKPQAKRWNYRDLQDLFAERPWRFSFPLVDRGETRADCISWLEGRVPHKTPRSACVYCPFHDDDEWQAVKDVPEDWALAVDVDRALRIPGNVVNRNMDQQLFLHRSCEPLEFVILNPVEDPRKAQLSMSFSGECLGVCGV